MKQFLYGQFLCVLNAFFLSFFAFHYWPISIIFSKLCSHLFFSSYNLIISFSLITFYSFIYKSISSIIQIELCVFLQIFPEYCKFSFFILSILTFFSSITFSIAFNVSSFFFYLSTDLFNILSFSHNWSCKDSILSWLLRFCVNSLCCCLIFRVLHVWCIKTMRMWISIQDSSKIDGCLTILNNKIKNLSSNRVPIACKFQLLNLMIPMSHFHFRRHKNRPYQTIGYTLQVHINIQSSQMDFKYCSLKRKPGFRHIYSFSLGFFFSLSNLSIQWLACLKTC